MLEDNKRNEALREEFTIKEFFLMLRKHIIVVITILIGSIVLGVTCSFVTGPKYSVTQKIAYKCDNSAISDMGTIVSNYNTMIAYGDTIIDLFDEGVVLDRANYYYNEYLSKKQISQEEADNYLANLKNMASAQQKDENYIPPTKKEEQLGHINKANIKIIKLSSENEPKFTFNVTYTDLDPDVAKEKLSFLVNSYALECCEGENSSKFFGEFKVVVSDLGVEDVSGSEFKLKLVAVFLMGGAVVSIIAAYILEEIKKKKQINKKACEQDSSATDGEEK